MRAVRRQDLVAVLAWILTAELVVALVSIGLEADGPAVGVAPWVAAGVTGALAASHWRWRSRPPRWLGGLGLLWVELSIVQSIASDPDPGSAGFLHLLLVWVGVLAFGFLPRRQAWAHTSLTLLATSAVWVRDGAPAADIVMAGALLAGTVVGVGLLLSLLVEQARSHARTDALTGIANRRGILAVLADAAEHASRTDRPLTVLVLDLDDFKAVNDAYGHSAGDAILRRTTAAWQAALREEDVVGRLGGDEFLVVLPDTDEDAAVGVATRLTAMTPDDVGVTIGHATVGPDEPVEAALHRADEHLYARKTVRRATADPPVSPTPPSPVGGRSGRAPRQ